MRWLDGITDLMDVSLGVGAPLWLCVRASHRGGSSCGSRARCADLSGCSVRAQRRHAGPGLWGSGAEARAEGPGGGNAGSEGGVKQSSCSQARLSRGHREGFLEEREL